MTKQPIYTENVSQLDNRNPKFKFTWEYEWLKEQAEGHRERMGEGISEFLLYFVKGGFLDFLAALPDLGGLDKAEIEWRYYTAFKKAIRDSDRRYAMYVKNQKAKGVVFLEGDGTEG